MFKTIFRDIFVRDIFHDIHILYSSFLKTSFRDNFSWHTHFYDIILCIRTSHNLITKYQFIGYRSLFISRGYPFKFTHDHLKKSLSEFSAFRHDQITHKSITKLLNYIFYDLQFWKYTLVLFTCRLE